MRTVEFTKNLLETVVLVCKSKKEVLVKLGQETSGVNIRHLERKLKKFNLDISHFHKNYRVPSERLLEIVNTSNSLKEVILKLGGKLSGNSFESLKKTDIISRY